MSVEVIIFFNQLKANLKHLQAKRSYKERTIFDWHGKRLRRKLEQGYLKGVSDCLKILNKTYRKLNEEVALNDGQR